MTDGFGPENWRTSPPIEPLRGLRALHARCFVGTHLGVRIGVIRSGGYRSGKNGAGPMVPRMTQIDAGFETPLDLGLHMFGSVQAFRANPLVPHVAGHTQWIPDLFPIADEASRVEGDLVPALMPILNDLRPEHRAILSDRGVAISHPDWIDADLTADAIHRAAQLVLVINQLRHRIPVATSLREHAAAWHDFARRHDLQTSNSPVAVWGYLEGLQVNARIERRPKLVVSWPNFSELREDGAVWAPVFMAAFPSPLPVVMAVEPGLQNAFEVVASVFADDERIGHAAFDKAFRVRCGEVDLARASQALLPIADALVSYLRAGHVSVSERGISFQPSTLGPPEAVGQVLEHLCDLARTAHQAIQGPAAARGIYR